MARVVRSLVTHPSNPIKSWSPSKASTFDACESHAAYDITHKPPQDDGPALVHGRKVHDELCSVLRRERAIDAIVEGRQYLTSCKALQPMVLRMLHEECQAAAELEVAFDREWRHVDWRAKNAWLRLKLDVVHRESKKEVVVTDWKTGRPNPKDAAQIEQYVVGVATLAKAERFTGVLVYLGYDKVERKTFTLPQVRALRDKWTAEGQKITDPKRRIIATPSEDACRFCPHHVDKGGPCKFGYAKTTVAGLRHQWGGGSL